VPLGFWPQALEFAATSFSIHQGSLVALQPPSAKPFVLAPFGSLVSIKTGEAPKFAAQGEDALFLGYVLQPGLRYRGEIKYILISDINEKRFHKVRTGESIKLLPGHWKFPVFDARRRALDAKLVDSLFEKSLPFDSDVFDDSGSPESSSPSQPSSASSPSASLPLPVPPVGQGPAPTNPERLPPGPVGRPALHRPPHWSTTDELKKQWSNFSKTKREKLNAEYRNSENARLAAEQLSSALLCILSGTAPTPPATACASVPLSTPTDADEPPPKFYQQPAEDSHVNH
jgi:hypothetical protein